MTINMLTVDARARPPARASGAPPQPTLRLVWCLEGPKPKLHLSLADSVWLRLVLRIRFAVFFLFSRLNPGWILRKWPFGHCCFGPRGLWLLPLLCFYCVTGEMVVASARKLCPPSSASEHAPAACSKAILPKWNCSSQCRGPSSSVSLQCTTKSRAPPRL